MICIYFWAGTFGSTVEYVIRSFTNEYIPIVTEISADGSMHGFEKDNHLINRHTISNFFNSPNRLKIATITCPSHDRMSLAEVLSLVESYSPSSKNILLYASDINYAELNRLFQYHKIINGAVYKDGLRSAMFANSISNIQQWNLSYQSVAEMQAWEFREWQSLFDYAEFLDTPAQVNNTFFKVSTEVILNNTVDTFEKIINWCGLTRNSADLIKFAAEWRERQQYVLDEYQLIVDIVDATINNVAKDIPEDLNIIAQSIIQRQLRKAGYEIRCDGLNKFPTDTISLHKLLDKNLILHKESQ